MKKMNLAIEDLDVNCDVQECPEDTTISDLEKDDQLISLQQDDLNQAEDISDTIETLATNVDTATGLSDEAAQVLNVVTEHFCRRLGYKHPIVPALESFNDTTRVQNTKLAVENLQKLNTQLKKSINIAHESLLDSIFETIVGVFSKEKELLMEVRRLKEETKNKQITVEEIPAKNWTTHLRTDSSVISGKDVVDILTRLKKSAANEDVAKKIRDLSSSVNSIKMDVKDTWLKVNKDTLNRVSEEYNVVKGLTEEFSREFLTKGKNGMKTLTPLTEEERTRILNDINSVLTDKSIDNEINKLHKEITNLFSALQRFLMTTTNIISASAMHSVGAAVGAAGFRATGAALVALNPGVGAGLSVLMGAVIVFTAGQFYLLYKGLNSELLLGEDNKSFKLLVDKTVKEVEEIVKSYRELTAEKLKICSAALNYVKASVY